MRSAADDTCFGNIISIDSDTITVNWDKCGNEVVKYVVENGTLSVGGARVESSGLTRKANVDARAAVERMKRMSRSTSSW
jgi:hypothetical protein